MSTLVDLIQQHHSSEQNGEGFRTIEISFSTFLFVHIYLDWEEQINA